MLYNLFYILLRINLMAMITTLVVFALKFILKKLGASRKVLFCLWAIIGIRLICPFSIESNLSLFNFVPNNAKEIQNIVNRPNIINSLDNLNDIKENTNSNSIENNVIPSSSTINTLNEIANIKSDNDININKKDNIKLEEIVMTIWIAGSLCMILYAIISYIKLKHTLKFAIKNNDYYETDMLKSPCVVGIFKPKIYLTNNLTEDEKKYILTHEKVHISRRDYFSKALAYLILSIHWINPYNWILFKMFVNDMEMCCDEQTIKKLGEKNKQSYMECLVNLSTKNSRSIVPCPIAFSENNTERRVKNMIKLKKSGVVISIIAVLVCIVLAVSCLTDKKETISNLSGDNNADVQVYSQVLDKLKNLITSDEDFESKAQVYQDNNFSYMYAYQDYKNLDIFEYALLDINNDGQKELLLYVNDGYYGNVIFDLYTIVNNEIVHALSSMERGRYILCEDGFIKEEFSSSASESGVNYYKLSENGNLELVEGILNTSLPALGSMYMGYVYTNSSGEESYVNDIEISTIEAKYKEVPVNKELLFGDEHFKDAEKQIDVMMNNIDTWLAKDEYGYQYAITDLDQNGRLEIIASICQGTGHFTTTKIFEVNEQKDGLSEIDYPYKDGDSMVDIVDTRIVCFYDNQNDIYHYIMNDLIKNGAAEYYENKRDFYIKDGKVHENFLAYKEEIYSSEDYKR